MLNSLPPGMSDFRPRTGGESLARVTVALVGLRPAVRSTIVPALERAADIAIVGDVRDDVDVLGSTAWRAPDVVVVDPLRSGTPAMERVVERLAARTRVLVLTGTDEDSVVRGAFRAGALGYLVTGTDHDQVPRGVRVVASGGVVVGRCIAGRFAALICTGQAPYPFPQLTARERDVLERIAAGKTNPVIARELALAPKTISNRVSTVFVKLGVAHRAEAIVLARDAGLGRG